MRGLVSKEDDAVRMVGEAAAELGGLDALVNNAGIQISRPSHELSSADFDKVLAVNLRSAFLCAREAIRRFLRTGTPGVVVNVSSVHQRIPKPGYLGYSVSKGGMQNLTTTLALEYAASGIRVNAIGPGATITPINRRLLPGQRRRGLHHRPDPLPQLPRAMVERVTRGRLSRSGTAGTGSRPPRRPRRA